MGKTRLLTIACGVLMIAANILGFARDDSAIEDLIDAKLDERFSNSEEEEGS